MVKDISYLIHDNGGRPFKVVISDNSRSISIYYNYNDKRYGELLYVISNPIKIFVGEDTTHPDKGVGNSILVHADYGKYVVIQGTGIYSFEPAHEITTFVADIGNSDVTYIYGLDEKYVYLLTERVFFEKSEYDPYKIYYGHQPTTTRKLRKVVDIYDRL